jgi:hypothetical protein
MSGWVEFDEVTITQQNEWYYADRVPGKFFKIELIEPAAPVKPEKLVVKRWIFDDDGDRILYGDARAIWLPPKTQALQLTSGNDDIDSNAGLAFYLSRRYNAFGIYRCSVWDSPTDMAFNALVSDDQLDVNGEILVTHGLGSVLLNTVCYYPINGRMTRINPDTEFATDNPNEYGFGFRSYRPYTGQIRILIERK